MPQLRLAPRSRSTRPSATSRATPTSSSTLARHGRRRAAPTSSRSPRCSSPATRSRTSRCARRSSRRPARRVHRPRAARSSGRGPRRPARRRRLPRPASSGRRRRRRAASRRAAERRRRPPRRRGRRPLRQAPPARTTASSTSSATSSPAPSRCVVRVRRRRRRARHLRGPLAGRRPGRRRTPRSRAGLLLVLNGSPYERNKDDVRLDARAGAARPRPAARSPTSTWSAARTSWSSTATRSSSPPTATLLARAPQFAEERPASSTSTSPRPTRRSDRRRTSSVDRPGARAVRRRRAARRRRRASCDEDEVYAALVARAARLRPEERLPRRVVLGLSGGIDSALVAAIACDALGAENVLRRLACRAPTPRSTRVDDAAELADALRLHYRTVPIEPMVDAFVDDARARPASPRRTCRRGCAAPR